MSLACASRAPHPVVASKILPSPIVSQNHEVLDLSLLEDQPGDPEAEGQPYHVGPGDTLLLAVFNHPELAIGAYTGTNAGAASLPSGRAVGYYVDNDGSIQFPLIGSVKVTGKTTEQLRAFLEKELAQFVKEPKVVVQVIFSGSIRYYLLGQFVTPGLKYSDRPLRLLEALSLGGSIALERASLTAAYVVRKGRKLPVNFRKLLRGGDMRYNVRLRSGDTVVVPDNQNEQAFVFGGAASSNARGGPVPFVHGSLDILQALAHAGMGFRDRAQGKLSEVRVLRSEADRGHFFVIDVDRILKGEAASFALAPGDIVFIPETKVTSWNEAIQQFLPTLQSISGLLNPFVQIKYLSQ